VDEVRTSSNSVSTACGFHRCLLSQCESFARLLLGLSDGRRVTQPADKPGVAEEAEKVGLK